MSDSLATYARSPETPVKKAFSGLPDTFPLPQVSKLLNMPSFGIALNTVNVRAVS